MATDGLTWSPVKLTPHSVIVPSSSSLVISVLIACDVPAVPSAA